MAIHIQEGTNSLITNDINIDQDDRSITFGAGNDASISYDGTDFNINPQEVGSGKVNVLGEIYATGDLNASTNGSTTTTPRVFGYTDLTSGEACRFQFGDKHNGFQNGYAKDTTIFAYWGIILAGGMQNYNSGFEPPTFTKTTDCGVKILSTNDIGDDPGAGATNIVTCVIEAVASQTNDLLQFRDSDSNVLAYFEANGTLGTNSGRKLNITTVNVATYDLLATDDILHVTYTSTGAVTSLTLPTAQTVAGRRIIVKDAGGNANTNNITIDTEGAETIDGSATNVISTDYGSVTLYSDGSNWFII